MKKRGIKKVVLMILSGLAVLLILTLVVLFASSGIMKQPLYLQPWERTYSEQFDDPRIRLAAHGLLAANGHNMQPWKIRLDTKDSRVFYLYADSDRLAKQVDPYARQTMISQGTFLEYVQVAGGELGYKTVLELFPDGNYDEQNLIEDMSIKPVAKVTLMKTSPQHSPLYSFIFSPDTNRGPYENTPFTEEQLSQLASINNEDDLTLKIYQDKENMEKLGNYAIKGAIIESSIHRINEESAAIFRANEYQKNKYRYGFSLEGQGTSGVMKHIMQGLITILPSINSEKTTADIFVKSTQTAINHTPAYSMIITKGNTRIEQVKSGMLYSRLVLNAHRLGFVMQPPSQVLEEYPEMKEQYSNIHRGYTNAGSTIQMFFRLGKPTQAFPQTMRRDVMDLMDTEY
ncbi:Acg family FMN-binding oxidoreductase [Paenibacillus wynnii]|uniref:Acg family FMN-binding oxidoreductase n=1 Tax=Paenibacillus wynnii TaxID=268407 RepID=UPI002791617C|nr:hypothetical protein [Paenibacillus wynnii]MDQ0194092.1 hypothetical protein [Paenibacillus wynnii]